MNELPKGDIIKTLGLLEIIDRHLRVVLDTGLLWRQSYPWNRSVNGRLRGIALNIEKLTDRTDKSRRLVYTTMFRIKKLLKEE